MSDVRPRKGGPYSLFCYDCGEWVPNTANSEMAKEECYSHSHRCKSTSEPTDAMLDAGFDILDELEEAPWPEFVKQVKTVNTAYVVPKERLEAMQKVVDAARYYHETENPKRGVWPALGECEKCGIRIATISWRICRVCAWEQIDQAIADLDALGAGE